MNRVFDWVEQLTGKFGIRNCAALIVMTACAVPLHAQGAGTAAQGAVTESPRAMQARIDKLEAEVVELKSIVMKLQASSPPALVSTTTASGTNAASASHLQPASNTAPAGAQQNAQTSEDNKVLAFLRDTTIDVGLDTYYAYNFNQPVGRVNLLRAYDVLSNEFSLNQASMILDHPPDLAQGRRWGGRLDLQYGQATDTLQGNPTNEPRPDIYRNIFQAYGTYIVPVGKGITVDFGKWSSSLGIEGNYTKDQIDYSRSYWFNFLPFYHMGVRVNAPVNDRFAVNYWLP